MRRRVFIVLLCLAIIAVVLSVWPLGCYRIADGAYLEFSGGGKVYWRTRPYGYVNYVRAEWAYSRIGPIIKITQKKSPADDYLVRALLDCPGYAIVLPGTMFFSGVGIDGDFAPLTKPPAVLPCVKGYRFERLAMERDLFYTDDDYWEACWLTRKLVPGTQLTYLGYLGTLWPDGWHASGRSFEFVFTKENNRETISVVSGGPAESEHKAGLPYRVFYVIEGHKLVEYVDRSPDPSGVTKTGVELRIIPRPAMPGVGNEN